MDTIKKHISVQTYMYLFMSKAPQTATQQGLVHFINRAFTYKAVIFIKVYSGFILWKPDLKLFTASTVLDLLFTLGY